MMSTRRVYGQAARCFARLMRLWASSISAGLTAWIKARGGTGAAEDAQAIATVRRFLEQHEESRFSLLLPAGKTVKQAGEDETRIGRPTVNRVGYRRETKAGGWEFLTFPEVWKSEICKGLDSLRVAEALYAACFLDKGDGKMRNTSLARSRVSLSCPKSPNVRQRPLLSEQ